MHREISEVEKLAVAVGILGRDVREGGERFFLGVVAGVGGGGGEAFAQRVVHGPMLMVPAVPPLPTISKRSFHAVGSLMAKLASGQMTPRTSQCSGRFGFAATSVAESILTWSPKRFSGEGVAFHGGFARRAGPKPKNGISQMGLHGVPFNGMGVS